jgi:DNA-binding response OmpR family regulator
MNKVKVLLVENDEKVAESLKSAFFEVSGRIKVDTCGNHIEAMERINTAGNTEDTEPIKIIISEIYFPEREGIKLLKNIRRHKEFYTTPVIFFTASEKREDITKAYNEGVNCYIPKPADPEDKEEYMRIVKYINLLWLKAEKE